MGFPSALLFLPLFAGAAPAAPGLEVFDHGEAIALDKVIPANERGIVCLAGDREGRIFGGTTGRAAHLFVYDPAKNETRDLARLEGGVGLSYGLVRLPDGSLVAGTQADPTGVAMKTDPKAVGHLYRFVPSTNGPARVEDLGVPVAGQGIYTVAFLWGSKEVLGNTWPDGHFFSYDLKKKKFKDHGTIAGYRTYEAPDQAADLNRGTDENIRYPRQVSRAIVALGNKAYTGGADGFLFEYDSESRQLRKTGLQLPAVPGRERWTSLDAVGGGLAMGGMGEGVLGTSDGFIASVLDTPALNPRLRCLGKPLAHGPIQGFVPFRNQKPFAIGAFGLAGGPDSVPRSFRVRDQETGDRWHAQTRLGGLGDIKLERDITPGGIPKVDGQLNLEGFGAVIADDKGNIYIADDKGNIYAGERDRIARLVRFRLQPAEKPKAPAPPPAPAAPPPAFDAPPRIDCRVVFAPQGTTTDGSGYTAIEVGKDGRVYVGSARYGGYGWLLRFDPAARPLFMDKVVNMRQLTGEHRQGINTQGKIHAKIVVGADGRVWFASKQAHEVFETRPEYGEDPDGFPGGHLCYFDPKTGFSRSMGILKKQEGLMGGVIDDARGKLYYRSEPRNHFLAYDIKTGDVQDRGHVGSACRYSAIDKGGAVYTPGRPPYLTRYDPETGYVEDLEIQVEGPGKYEPPYVVALGPNGKLYGAAAGHPSIMEFDIDRYRPGPFPRVTMRNVAPAAPPGMPVLDIHAGVFGKDGKFYYPLNTSAPLQPGGQPQPQLRLMRFDPVTKKSETVGLPNVVGLDESKVEHVYARKAKYNLQYMQGAAVGADGSLYLMAIYPQLNVACFPGLTAPKK